MAKGDGSITEVLRSDGKSHSPKRWRVCVSFGNDPVTKKRIKVQRVVSGSKADARKLRDQIRKEHESGLSLEAEKALLGDFLTEWVGNRAASGELAHATVTNYERYVRVWIVPYLGGVPIKDLKPYTVESWHREARKDGVTPRTLQAAHKVLKQALRDAVRYGLTLANPCDLVKTPKAEARKRGYLEPAEVRRMLGVLDGMEESAFTMVVRLGVATGARRGEVLGLSWRYVDFERGCIYVVQSLSQVDGAHKAKRPAKELKATKTEAGKRRIAVDGETMRRLSAWKGTQALELLKLGIRQNANTPVCCSLYDAEFQGVRAFAGQSIDPQGFSSRFARFCEEHGFFSTTGKRLCFHELRHTQATLLLSSGEDIVSVSGRLGHASPSITSDMYAHAMPEKDRECATVIGNLLSAPVAARVVEAKTA